MESKKLLEKGEVAVFDPKVNQSEDTQPEDDEKKINKLTNKKFICLGIAIGILGIGIALLVIFLTTNTVENTYSNPYLVKEWE